MSASDMTSNPMLSKAAEPSSATSRTSYRGEASLPLGADPDAVLDKIRSLITDHFLTARRMAVAAAAKFPGHAGLRNAKRILTEGKAKVVAEDPQPSRSEEFQWLRDPPDSVRGKWVALIGSELVGSAETLAELAESLHSRSFPRAPLVHRGG